MAKKQKRNYEYINEFTNENYDRITIIVPKGSKDRIKLMAKERGQTVSDFITGLMPRTLIGKWKKKGKEQEEEA